MKKKILLIVVALFIFYMPLSITHQEVNAVAVASKVVNAGAKKIAKEVAVDTAVQMSMNMIMDYKYTPKDTTLTPKPGFAFVCMPRQKTPSGDCTQPIEVKGDLTKEEKVQLSRKVESTLETKIAGGVTSTKWGKFLDWVVPVFSVGLGVAVIDYAINGDVSDLFDEIGYDSMVSMGLITGVTVNEQNPNINVPKSMLNEVVAREGSTRASVTYNLKETSSTQYMFYSDVGNVKKRITHFRYTINNSNKTASFSVYNGGSFTSPNDAIDVVPYSIDQKQFDELVKWDNSIGGLVSPDRLQSAILSAGPPTHTSIYLNTPIEGNETSVPRFDELDMPRTNQANTNLKVPAPGSLPFTKTDTGETLLPYAKPDGTTGFKTKTGVEVPEDNVTVGSPVITENADGSKSIKKQPTVANPNPSPSEDGKLPAKDDEITEGDLEGLSCTRLKKPDFKPLTNAFTTSFPFSIPWDLQRMFNAAFSEIGSNEPNFEYKFEFNGQIKTWKIGFPDYFANWTNFTRPLLLIIFDIGLIYAIYRFTKGSD